MTRQQDAEIMKQLRDVNDEPEHPDDKDMREQAEVTATRKIDRFFADNADRFRALVLTYGDGAAEDLCASLREDFWGELDELPE